MYRVCSQFTNCGHSCTARIAYACGTFHCVYYLSMQNLEDQSPANKHNVIQPEHCLTKTFQVTFINDFKGIGQTGEHSVLSCMNNHERMGRKGHTCSLLAEAITPERMILAFLW